MSKHLCKHKLQICIHRAIKGCVRICIHVNSLVNIMSTVGIHVYKNVYIKEM